MAPRMRQNSLVHPLHVGEGELHQGSIDARFLFPAPSSGMTTPMGATFKMS